MQIVDLERHNRTYDDVSEIARRAAVWSHLCCCAVVLVVLWREGFSSDVISAVAVEMVLFVTVPLIIAAVVAEAVVALSLRDWLHIPLFVRMCVITIELVLLSWGLVLIHWSRPPASL